MAAMATDRQRAYLRDLMAECYSEAEIKAYFARPLSKSDASAAIQAMLDAGYGKRAKRQGQRSTGRARKSRQQRWQDEFDDYADFAGEGAAVAKYGMGWR